MRLLVRFIYCSEDLLLSALASCHMMSYLYVCEQNNIEVLSYTDTAEAILNVEPSGSGHFSKVTLKPVVTIKDALQAELAKTLHNKANSLCFIANSCNFPITHQTQILIK
ncbi:OsmC-like protein [Algibacter pectinivorans]|uniref:OsmC-like protein n=1 Tax=Algibacter pectinivorans TaxID=870482 RepID=A0A1I1QSB4_9FLAO|nr:OsmC-like protein [Algibacter pectinivorans]